MEIIKLFQDYASKAHEGQTRKNGQPYITHCKSVAEMVLERVTSTTYYDNNSRPYWEKDVAVATAWGHDIFEDNPVYFGCLLQYPFAKTFVGSEVLRRIIVLSRPNKKDMNIFEYLDRIKEDEICQIVKLKDLEHNMSDLEPGNLMDKYALCENYLLH